MFLVIKWLSEVKPISDNLITFYCIAIAVSVFLSETQPIPKYNTASDPQLNQYVYFNPVVLMTYAVATVLLHIWLYLIRLQTAQVSIKLSYNSTATSKGGIAPFGTEIYSFSWQVCPAATYIFMLIINMSCSEGPGAELAFLNEDANEKP